LVNKFEFVYMLLLKMFNREEFSKAFGKMVLIVFRNDMLAKFDNLLGVMTVDPLGL